MKLAKWASASPNLSFLYGILVSLGLVNFIFKGLRIYSKEEGLCRKVENMAKTTKMTAFDSIINVKSL